MFRYGGPIKEGVMSGIREPKKTGGSMREAQQWNTVGSPVFPKDSSGRAHHVLPAALLAAAPWLMNAARFAPAAWRGMKAARTFAPWAKNLGKWGRAKNILLPKKSITAPMAKGWEKAGFNTGAFMRSNPVTSFGIGSMIPQAGYLGYKGAKAAPGTIWEGTKRWADAVIPGDQSRWWKDKPPVKIDEKDKVTETNPWKEKYEALVKENKVPKKSDEEIRAEKLQKYRDIVDIKGMNSEAAANSLIEASRLINESQDFKGDIRSGSLINKIIQGASKAYDKPADMRRAIDTLILKGEIEGDIASGKAGTLEKNIDTIASNLNISKEDATKLRFGKPVNLREQVTSDMSATKQQAVTHKGLISSTKKWYPKAQVMLTGDEYDKTVGDDSTGEAYVKTKVTDKLSKDPNAKVAGVYIVGKEVVQVDGAGNTLTLFP